jgi:hypothetical protein
MVSPISQPKLSQFDDKQRHFAPRENIRLLIFVADKDAPPRSMTPQDYSFFIFYFLSSIGAFYFCE